MTSARQGVDNQKPQPKGSAIRWTEADLYRLLYPSPLAIKEAARYWKAHAPERYRRLLEAIREGK